MKIEKKKIYFFLILTLSISLSVFSWNSINLPSTNSEIIGNYYLNGVSSFNDVVRYVVFMAIPVIFYLSWKFIFEKNKPNDLLSNIKLIKDCSRERESSDLVFHTAQVYRPSGEHTFIVCPPKRLQKKEVIIICVIRYYLLSFPPIDFQARKITCRFF